MKERALLFKVLMTISKSPFKTREDNPMSCARVKALATIIASTEQQNLGDESSLLKMPLAVPSYLELQHLF